MQDVNTSHTVFHSQVECLRRWVPILRQTFFFFLLEHVRVKSVHLLSSQDRGKKFIIPEFRANVYLDLCSFFCLMKQHKRK